MDNLTDEQIEEMKQVLAAHPRLRNHIEQVKLIGVRGLAMEVKLRKLHTVVEGVVEQWREQGEPMTATEVFLRNALLSTQP